MVLDKDGKEIARNEDCPGVHGEAGSQGRRGPRLPDGVLIYADGAFTKVESPTEYGRIGNQAGCDARR